MSSARLMLESEDIQLNEAMQSTRHLCNAIPVDSTLSAASRPALPRGDQQHPLRMDWIDHRSTLPQQDPLHYSPQLLASRFHSIWTLDGMGTLMGSVPVPAPSYDRSLHSSIQVPQLQPQWPSIQQLQQRPLPSSFLPPFPVAVDSLGNSLTFNGYLPVPSNHGPQDVRVVQPVERQAAAPLRQLLPREQRPHHLQSRQPHRVRNTPYSHPSMIGSATVRRPLTKLSFHQVHPSFGQQQLQATHQTTPLPMTPLDQTAADGFTRRNGEGPAESQPTDLSIVDDLSGLDLWNIGEDFQKYSEIYGLSHLESGEKENNKNGGKERIYTDEDWKDAVEVLSSDPHFIINQSTVEGGEEDPKIPIDGNEEVELGEFEGDEFMGLGIDKDLGEEFQENFMESITKMSTDHEKVMDGGEEFAEATEKTNASECELTKTREKRFNLYKSMNEDLFEIYPHVGRNTDIILADFAFTLGKSKEALIMKNDKFWEKLENIKDLLKKEEIQSVEKMLQNNGDDDLRRLLYLVAYLNRYKRNVQLERVEGMYKHMVLPSDVLPLDHLIEEDEHSIVFSCEPDTSQYFVYFDHRVIPVEGGLRVAMLSLMAVSSLFDIEFDHRVNDVESFLFLSTGKTLRDVPQSIKKARRKLRSILN